MSSAENKPINNTDKLTIEFCEQMANGVKALGDLRPLFKRLADTMRENERLEAERASLEKENEVMLQWLRKYHPRYKESDNG